MLIPFMNIKRPTYFLLLLVLSLMSAGKAWSNERSSTSNSAIITETDILVDIPIFRGPTHESNAGADACIGDYH